MNRAVSKVKQEDWGWDERLTFDAILCHAAQLMVNVGVRDERGSKGVIVTASASASAGCGLNIIFTINIINSRA